MPTKPFAIANLTTYLLSTLVGLKPTWGLRIQPDSQFPLTADVAQLIIPLPLSVLTDMGSLTRAT